MQTFAIQPTIYFNEGSLEYLKTLPGQRAFLVADSVMDKLGYIATVKEYLQAAGLQTAVFTGVRPDPDVKVIADGMKAYLAAPADVIVALGGGSVIDAAKGILYSLQQFQQAGGSIFHKPLFIAIPTTSGTGSEVTNFSVITAENEKICVVDKAMAPDIAILDSRFIRKVPPAVIADTGIDALVHALEAYVATTASDCSDALAEKAVQLIFEHLRDLHKDPDNSFARDRVQNASCIAGMAFTNAGLGINHSLAHALGATFHLSHGRANALLLNPVIEYNANLSDSAQRPVAQRYAKLAALLQLPARTPREGTMNLMQAIRDLQRDLGIPASLRQAGLDKETFDREVGRMAEMALHDRCTPTNPRCPTAGELAAIYQKAF